MEISNKSREQAINSLNRLIDECDLSITESERVGIINILSEEFEIAFQEGCGRSLKFLNRLGVLKYE